jgi:hypothetical protein
MLAAVNLDQLSEGLTAQSRLMEAAALSGKPQPIAHHLLPQRLSGDAQVVLGQQYLCSEGGTEISVVGKEQAQQPTPGCLPAICCSTRGPGSWMTLAPPLAR